MPRNPATLPITVAPLISIQNSEPVIDQLIRGWWTPRRIPLTNSFTKTNLDLESNLPSGGPINDPASRYVHKYTSDNTYLNYIAPYR